MLKKFILSISLISSLYGADMDTVSGSTDIGGGRNIYSDCKGTGSPAVILISGHSHRADIWEMGGNDVFSEIAKFTHVCAYDRPGTGSRRGETAGQSSRSTPQENVVTAKDAVDDLHAWLKASKTEAPYVLVGHSYGGLIARLYASTYPNEVKGLVLIDALSEFLYDELDMMQQVILEGLNSNFIAKMQQYPNIEKVDVLKSFAELKAALAIPKMPVVVLTADNPFQFQALATRGLLPPDSPVDLSTVLFEKHQKSQALLAKNLNAKQITKTNAGHYIQLAQPQLVADTIREVVDSVRSEKK